MYISRTLFLKWLELQQYLIFFQAVFLFERYDRGVEEYQSEILFVGLVREVNLTLTATLAISL
jgi:hypothetical protein